MGLTIFGVDYEDGRVSAVGIGGILEADNDEPVAAYFRRVVHGRWIDKPTGAYGRRQSWCSACGRRSGIGGVESNRHKPYCPNCGARMDGGG